MAWISKSKAAVTLFLGQVNPGVNKIEASCGSRMDRQDSVGAIGPLQLSPGGACQPTAKVGRGVVVQGLDALKSDLYLVSRSTSGMVYDSQPHPRRLVIGSGDLHEIPDSRSIEVQDVKRSAPPTFAPYRQIQSYDHRRYSPYGTS